jgi:hypothetical protein
MELLGQIANMEAHSDFLGERAGLGTLLVAQILADLEQRLVGAESHS